MKMILSLCLVLCFTACSDKPTMPDREEQLYVSVDNKSYRLISLKDLILDSSVSYSFETVFATELFTSPPSPKVYRGKGNSDSSMILSEFRAGERVVTIGLDTAQVTDLMYIKVGGDEIYFKIRDLNNLVYLGYSKTSYQYFEATIAQKRHIFSLKKAGKGFDLIEYNNLASRD